MLDNFPCLRATTKDWVVVTTDTSKGLITKKYLIKLKLSPILKNDHVMLMTWSCACKSVHKCSYLFVFQLSNKL